jgi:hypothetical protein
MLVIKFERGNRRTPTGCEANNFHAVITPPKVFAPDVLAWIEQRHFFSRRRVRVVCSGTLEAIA